MYYIKQLVKNLFKYSFVGLFLCVLTSCSYFYGDQGIIHNRDTEYLKAQDLPPLNIPPGLSSSTFEAHYPTKGLYYPSSNQAIGLTPPGLEASK